MVTTALAARLRRNPVGGRRLRRSATVFVALLCVTVLAADAWVLLQRNRSTTVHLEDVLARFRDGERPPSEPSVTEAAGAQPVPSAQPATEATVVPVAASEPAPTDGPAPSAAPPPVAVADVPADVRPAEGVYTYRTSGGEEISVAAASHRYPERTYATVRHGGGCEWEMRSDVIEEHTDRRTVCTERDRVLQLSQSREVEFFGQRDSATLTCTPPLVAVRLGEAPGTVESTDCTDGRAHARLERVFLATETMTIAGTAVQVQHIRITGTLTGRARGESLDDLWLLPSGLPARWKRSIDTDADAAFGASVRYREDAEFVLESLAPQR